MQTKKELYYTSGFDINVDTNQDNISNNTLINVMVALSNNLLKSNIGFTSLNEVKIFTMVLTKIKWNELNNSNIIKLNKREIYEVMGWKATTADEVKDCGKKLRKLLNLTMDNSKLSFTQETKKMYAYKDGYIICSVATKDKTFAEVEITPSYMSLLEDLVNSKDFLTLWANDIYAFTSIYSFLLYLELRQHSDTRRKCVREYTTAQLKEIFKIPFDGKGSYVKYDKRKDKMVFDRANFEKKVIDKAISEINKSQMVFICPPKNIDSLSKNKLYAKNKKGNSVDSYRFEYHIKSERNEPVDVDEVS